MAVRVTAVTGRTAVTGLVMECKSCALSLRHAMVVGDGCGSDRQGFVLCTLKDSCWHCHAPNASQLGRQQLAAGCRHHDRHGYAVKTEMHTTVTLLRSGFHLEPVKP